MKLDDNVERVNLETTIILSKAVEIFIKELNLFGWIHAKNQQRRILMKNDISMAVAMYNQFYFLTDIVPRVKATKKTDKREFKTSKNPKQVIITTPTLHLSYIKSDLKYFIIMHFTNDLL